MYNNILIPVAFDGEHPTGPAEEIARHLAAPKARVTFLHVMEEMPAYVVNYFPAGYDQEARKAVQAALDEKVDRFENATGAVVQGHSGRSILEWAEEKDNDLIIIASHRPGFSDLFLGSTAARVVRHAQCAVHVLR